MDKTFGAGRGEGFTALFQFILLALFAVFALLVTVLSVRACQRAEDVSDDTRALRSGLTYAAGKIRAGDRAGCVTVEERDGQNVLMIQEKQGEVPYVTYIYWRDGALWETYTRKEYPFSADSGVRVFKTGEMTFWEEPGAILLTVPDGEGGACSLRVGLRAGEAGA